MTEMKPLSEDLKEGIIDTHEDGIWIVLGEELPRDTNTPADILPLDDAKRS